MTRVSNTLISSMEVSSNLAAFAYPAQLASRKIGPNSSSACDIVCTIFSYGPLISTTGARKRKILLWYNTETMLDWMIDITWKTHNLLIHGSRGKLHDFSPSFLKQRCIPGQYGHMSPILNSFDCQTFANTTGSTSYLTEKSSMTFRVEFYFWVKIVQTKTCRPLRFLGLGA